MDEIIVRQIPCPSVEYSLELNLRNRILRRPLNLDIASEDLSPEPNDTHIGAFAGGALVGVLVLTAMGSKSMRMRQVAVETLLQGRGVGTAMVRFAEQTAFSQGFNHIVLHARKTAVDFYLRLGYRAMGEEFTEIGIPHLAMQKDLS